MTSLSTVSHCKTPGKIWLEMGYEEQAGNLFNTKPDDIGIVILI